MNDLERELYTKRALGILPHIDIAGTDFTIDWGLRELRETASPWNRIDLRHKEMNNEGDEYYFLYRTDSHEEYQFNDLVMEVPVNVVFAVIPYELKLDPYAAGRNYTTDLKDFVKRFPIQQNLKAVIKPLSETSISELVAQNQLRNRKINDENPANHTARVRSR